MSAEPAASSIPFASTPLLASPQGQRGAGPEYVEQLIALAAIGRLDLRPSMSAHIPLAAAAAAAVAVAQLERKVGDASRLVLIP